MVFAVLFAIPFMIASILFFVYKTEITLKEFAVQMVFQALIAITSSVIIYNNNTSDTQLLHGQVSSKTRDLVSCEHSYKCNCYESCSGSGSNRSCHEVCSTCYEHSYDVDWNVRSNIGYKSTISRVDRRGLKEPNRWSIAKIGEPYSVQVNYENYIKGSPHSLFQSQGQVEKYKSKLVNYKGNTFDYYRASRVMGQSIPRLDEKLLEINSRIGSQKQASLGIVFTKQPRDYFYALEESWIGGKKNDIIPVVGINDNDEIQWVEIMAWVKDPIFKIKLRDDILSMKKIDVDSLAKTIEEHTVNHYQRKPMSDFEYLKSSIKPTVTQWVISLILGIAISLFISFYMKQKDLFDEER